MKVIIMAGGMGTRIASIASDVPKPMIRICGKPILEYEPRSRGTLAYLNLAKEVIEKNGTQKTSVG